MPRGRRQRKVLLGLGVGLAVLLVLWFSLPLWFPWLLRPLAQRQGASYARFERQGYSRFVLYGVGFTNQNVRFHAERIEAVVPNVWLWRVAVATHRQSFLRVEHWQFESVPTGKVGGSVYSNAQKVGAALRTVQRWLPMAALSNGTIRLPQRVIHVPTAMWNDGVLTASVGLLQPSERGTLQADIRQAPIYKLQFESDTFQLQSNLKVAVNGSGLGVESTAYWWSNRIDLHAQFAREGLLPVNAALQATNFHLPAESVRLPYYGELLGSGSARWERGQFAFDLTGGAVPLASHSNLPPISLSLHARGDTNAATLESASFSAPWLSLELSRELELHFTGPLLREPATLKVAADLARQPWFTLQGVLSGEADFRPTAGEFPLVRFHLAGEDLGQTSLKAKSVTLAGSLDWPWLALTNADALFADGSTAAVTGRMEMEKKNLADVKFKFDGPLAPRWLPAGYSYESLSLVGEARGPLHELSHSGHLEAAKFSSPHLAPLQLRADWTGQNQNLVRAEIIAATGDISLLLRGSLTNVGTQFDLTLASLSLSTNRQPLLELAQPCQISASHSASNHLWRLSVTPFDWTGKAGEVHAQASTDWPRQAELRLSIQKFSSTPLAVFAKTNLPALEIQNLNTSAGWTNGPAIFALDLSATVRPGTEPEPPGPRAQNSAEQTIERELSAPLSVDLHLRGDNSGLALSNLVVNSRTSEVATIRGFLPLTVAPAVGTNFIQLQTQQPLKLTASAHPQAFFWNLLAGWTGLRLREPRLNLNISGTWREPRGEVELTVQQLHLSSARHALPTFEDLRATLQLDREQARLVEGQLRVQGQPVSLTGELPLGQSFWDGLRAKKFPNWEKASAHLQIDGAELAAFEPLLPNILAPQGELNLDVSLAPGPKFDGELTVQHARTRPLANAGPIRDIDVKMRFHERVLKLESATANVGGATITTSGQADLRGTDWLKGALPPFEFALQGADVPLARQSEFIVRSDLVLGVAKTNGAPPFISGGVHLRDSYYLSDLRALVPVGVKTPSRRPPYFSLEDPFFADWRLAVDVQGARFMKVRSTLFNGEVSANLKLRGTLEDPIALGDLRIDSGTVRFPFGSFQVQQGLVNLTSQDPYRPQLAVRAVSKQFGYDLRMEINGPVDAPVIQFTSSPPLSSEQILLMVTAGQIPQGSFTLTPQQKAQTVAVFVGRDLLAKLGVGDQAQERLSIRSGEEISEQGRPTYRVEYKLSERWALEGEYDRFGDFNAGFKWRIYSK